MSLIEGDTLFNYPLFSSSDIPIDLGVHSIAGSPRFQQIKRLSQDLNAPQTVPNTSAPMASNLGFSLIMSGGIDKEFPLNANLLKGLQMNDDNLFQSGLIQNPNKIAFNIPEVKPIIENIRVLQAPLAADTSIVPEYSLHPSVFPIPKAEMAYDEPLVAAKPSSSKKRKAAPAHVPVPSPASEAHRIPSPVEASNQKLSPDEERNQKRQRRLVKNREAAQLFRQRQKAYIQDLEKRVGELSGTNNEYRARMELVNSENKLIKEQLLYLRNFVAQQAVFSFPTNGQIPDTSDGGSPTPRSPEGMVLPTGFLTVNASNIQGLMAAMGPEFLNPATLALPGGLPISMPLLNTSPCVSQGSASVPHTLNLASVVRPMVAAPLPLSPVSSVPDSDDRNHVPVKMVNMQMSR